MGEHEDEDFDDVIVRAKWVYDGAETLSQAAKMLREEANRLESLEHDGWQLTEPVQDDYGFIRRT